MSEKHLLVPIPKSPYYRIGPHKWQDWYRQVVRTINIAHELQTHGGKVSIAILSAFQPHGKRSEIEIYTEAFRALAPDLEILPLKETSDTLGQVERGFALAQETGAKLIFISGWMQYPRVLYLAHRRNAKHYGVFGIPSPLFALIDPLAMIVQPFIMLLGLGNVFQRITVRRREKGTIW